MKHLIRKSISTALLLVGTRAFTFAQGERDTRLPDAARQGDTQALRFLLQQGAGVDSSQGDGTTALHWAALRGDIEAVEVLLRHGAKVGATTRIGAITPLWMASRTGGAAVISALLNAGADANQANTEGTTPLMMAAASGNVAAVRALIQKGADVNAKELAHGQTAAMFAAALNRDEVLKELARSGADLNAITKTAQLSRVRTDADGNPITDEDPPAAAKTSAAAKTERAGDAVKAAGQIPRPGREFGGMVTGGMTALLFAARDGHAAATHSLMEAGADVNKVSAGDHTSPLVMAALNGHYDIAKYFLDHGADPNLANDVGLTPLYAVIDVEWAPHSWYPQPNTSQEKVRYLELMKLLVEKGANVNARLGKKLWYRGLAQDGEWADAAGSTALWRAARANDLAAMRFLVEHGADPKIPSTQGDTPLMMAAGVGWEGNYTANISGAWVSSVQYLTELGSDVNAVDTRGYTALHGAAYVGQNDVIRYLASKGANAKARSQFRMGTTNGIVKASDGKGDTTADMANGPREKSQVHADTVALLEELGSENSHNCRSNECLVLPVEDKKPATPDTTKPRQ